MRNNKVLISTLLLTGLGLAVSGCVAAPYSDYAYDTSYSTDDGYYPGYYPAPVYYTATNYYAPAYYGPPVGIYYAAGWRSGSDRDRWRH